MELLQMWKKGQSVKRQKLYFCRDCGIRVQQSGLLCKACFARSKRCKECNKITGPTEITNGKGYCAACYMIMIPCFTCGNLTSDTDGYCCNDCRE